MGIREEEKEKNQEWEEKRTSEKKSNKLLKWNSLNCPCFVVWVSGFFTDRIVRLILFAQYLWIAFATHYLDWAASANCKVNRHRLLVKCQVKLEPAEIWHFPTLDGSQGENSFWPRIFVNFSYIPERIGNDLCLWSLKDWVEVWRLETLGK